MHHHMPWTHMIQTDHVPMMFPWFSTTPGAASASATRGITLTDLFECGKRAGNDGMETAQMFKHLINKWFVRFKYMKWLENKQFDRFGICAIWTKHYNTGFGIVEMFELLIRKWFCHRWLPPSTTVKASFAPGKQYAYKSRKHGNTLCYLPWTVCHIFIYFPHWQSVLDIPILGTSGKICIEHLEPQIDSNTWNGQIRSEGEIFFETAMGQARITDFGRCNSPFF